jgi:LuxR family maltose regulon positive regulatory protein
LQLAALSMQGRQDIADFVSAFTGSNRFILDYLTEEVLQRQSPEIQTFLLQTSILDQMNAPLADAVTGRNDSALVLAQLEKANLFLIPLDDARQWYRYHHLFDDLLQSRLQQSRPEQVAELHRRAGTWYEQSGFLNEAIAHALAIPDFERAVRLIEEAALPLLVRSENSTVFNWIEQLPDDLIRTRPYLCLVHAAALLNVNKIDSAEARLAQVDDAQLDPQARAMSGLLRAIISLMHTDAEQALESARHTLAAMEASSANSNSPRAEIDTVVILFLVMVLAELQTVAGQLRAAYDTCRHGLEIGKSLSFGSPWALILGFLHFQTAELLYEFNEIGAADQHAAQSLEICRAIRNEEMESYTLVALAQIKQSEGDAASAFDLLQRAMRLERKRNIPSEMWFVAARQINVLIAQDRIEDAAQLVNELPLEDASAWFIERGMVAIGRARVLIARREYALAVELLEQLRAQSQTAAQTGMLVNVLALESLARFGQGDAAQARTVLWHALSLAEPEGYMRLFVDLGEPMQGLISDLRLRIEQNKDNQPLAAYADKLLAAFPTARVPVPNHKPLRDGSPSAMPEPLSERELAVLRLIAEGLSNQEIADRMVVAVSTVKTHINNIYGKLGVATRTQALARAREFKLF